MKINILPNCLTDIMRGRMNKTLLTALILCGFTSPVFAVGFDTILPANPLTPRNVSENVIAIPVKKATLTHNSIHNQYVLAFDRFVQSNVKPAYNDFKILIETVSSNDYVYMKLAENMADIGLFDLSELALSKVEDKSISDLIAEDIKFYYYPAKKMKTEDEIYLGEVFANIVYNDQSREATTELVKNTHLLAYCDYANYIAALGYLKSNDFAEAEVYINYAIQMNPQNLNYKKLKAEILSQGKKPQNAIKLVNYIKSQKLYSAEFERKVNSLEQYVLYKSKKNYSEKMYHLGYYYYCENENSKAVRTLQSALSNKKKLNKDIYSLLARVYYDSQDYEKAQDTALKAIKIDDDDVRALCVLGDLSYRNKDYKTALKYYRHAQNGTKSSYEPSVKIAQTYEKLNKPDKATGIYEKLLKNYDDCCIAYYKTALEDKTREVTYLKKTVAINMNFVDAWIDLGRVALEKKDFSQAKKYLRIANYIDENNFRYYYYQGMLAKKQGLDGVPYFKKSLILNPDYLPAKEELKI